MPFQELGAKSPDGNSIIAVVPFVKPDGEPSVMVIVKKQANGVFDTTLDGQPAFGFSLGENETGNAPWTVGDLLVDNWEKAKKLARKS